LAFSVANFGSVLSENDRPTLPEMLLIALSMLVAEQKKMILKIAHILFAGCRWF